MNVIANNQCTVLPATWGWHCNSSYKKENLLKWQKNLQWKRLEKKMMHIWDDQCVSVTLSSRCSLTFLLVSHLIPTPTCSSLNHPVLTPTPTSPAPLSPSLTLSIPSVLPQSFLTLSCQSCPACCRGPAFLFCSSHLVCSFVRLPASKPPITISSIKATEPFPPACSGLSFLCSGYQAWQSAKNIKKNLFLQSITKCFSLLTLIIYNLNLNTIIHQAYVCHLQNLCRIIQ